MANYFDTNGSKYLIVGLGNPGFEYEYTRHNAGFMAVDYISKFFKVKTNKAGFKSFYCDVKINKESVILLKPQTYMNLSGEAVFGCMQFYKIPIENLLVIFDDVSLDIGDLRIRKSGSSGGHNGVKSIINLLGTDCFKRIRLGVGAKPCGWDLPDWVLSRFSSTELIQLMSCMESVLPAIELIIKGKIDQAMNKFN